MSRLEELERGSVLKRALYEALKGTGKVADIGSTISGIISKEDPQAPVEEAPEVEAPEVDFTKYLPGETTSEEGLAELIERITKKLSK